MTKERETLNLALEAIHDLESEINGYRTVDFPIPEKAKVAIKEVLSQPQRKPLTNEQADQIIAGIQDCHHQTSKREFLKVWLRDWATHGIKA